MAQAYPSLCVVTCRFFVPLAAARALPRAAAAMSKLGWARFGFNPIEPVARTSEPPPEHAPPAELPPAKRCCYRRCARTGLELSTCPECGKLFHHMCAKDDQVCGRCTADSSDSEEDEEGASGDAEPGLVLPLQRSGRAASAALLGREPRSALACGSASELERPRAVRVTKKAKTAVPTAEAASGVDNSAATKKLTTKVTKDTVKKRLEEFPGEGLAVNISDRTQLWCCACVVAVEAKKSNVQSHVRGKVHINNKADMQKREQVRHCFKLACCCCADVMWCRVAPSLADAPCRGARAGRRPPARHADCEHSAYARDDDAVPLRHGASVSCHGCALACH